MSDTVSALRDSLAQRLADEWGYASPGKRLREQADALLSVVWDEIIKLRSCLASDNDHLYWDAIETKELAALFGREIPKDE